MKVQVHRIFQKVGGRTDILIASTKDIFNNTAFKSPQRRERTPRIKYDLVCINKIN
jgi:hypothetical protein